MSGSQPLKMYPTTVLSCIQNNCYKIEVVDVAVGNIMIGYTIVALVLVMVVMAFAIYKTRQAKKEASIDY